MEVDVAEFGPRVLLGAEPHIVAYAASRLEYPVNSESNPKPNALEEIGLNLSTSGIECGGLNPLWNDGNARQ
jgi:hypothetical protein